MKTFYKIWIRIAFGAIGLGLVFCLITVTIGGNNMNYNQENYRYSMEDTVENISSISLDIDYGVITLEEGDAFHLEVKNMEKDALQSYIDGDTWVIESKKNKNGSFRLFNLNIPWNAIGYNTSSSLIRTEITITIPKDFEADKLHLTLGAGIFFANRLKAESADINVGAGKMEINSLVISTDSTYSVGAGELIIQELDASNTTLDCGVGSIQMTGRITGNSDISCGIGEIALDLQGSEYDYNYKIDCGIGHVQINNNSFGGSFHKNIKNADAQNQFNLDCGIGEIRLHFEK